MKNLTFLFAPLIFIISFLFKKDKKIWLYGAWYGKRYSDNSRSLFEQANEIYPEIQHIWIYKDKNVLHEIPNSFNSIYAYSIKGFYLQLKSKVFICTLNSSDFIPFCITPRNILIQLWHGSPLKTIGIDSRLTFIRKIVDYIRFHTIDSYSMCISASDFFDNAFKSAFLLNQKQIFRANSPRNKSLFISQTRKNDIIATVDIL